MRIQKEGVWLTLAVLVFATVTSASLLGESRNTPLPGSQEQKDLSQYPVTDFDAPEPSDPAKRAQRQAKGKKFNKKTKAVDPLLVQVIQPFHWPVEFPVLPVAQSDVVIMGEVSEARSFLSADKTGVYSEFTIRVGEVFKSNTKPPLTANNPIIADREGGRVKFPSGQISRVLVAGLDMPRVGRKYVFFLTSNESDFTIVTAYELRAGRVFPLDNSPIFQVYRDAEASAFLGDVRAAVAGNSRKTTN